MKQTFPTNKFINSPTRTTYTQIEKRNTAYGYEYVSLDESHTRRSHLSLRKIHDAFPVLTSPLLANFPIVPLLNTT